MEIFYVTLVLAGMFTILIKQWFPPDVTLFSVLSILILTNVISVEEAFQGFANKSVITIALLFIISNGLFNSGMLHHLIEKVLKYNGNFPLLLLKMMISVSILSAFINNTPIVSTLTPLVRNWGLSNGVNPSKLLIPLSYAAILGGTITLYGTSTNLMVDGLLQQSGHPGFTVLEFSYLGIPLTLVGLVYMYLIGRHLLPHRNYKSNLTPMEKIDNSENIQTNHFRNNKILVFVLLVMFTLAAFQFISIIKAAIIAVLILLATKSISPAEARKSIDWSVIILISSAIGIGAAIEKSGVTEAISIAILYINDRFGLLGTAITIYLVTMILTEISHNIAAAAMMFPLGYSVALEIGTDPKMFAMIIAISASCSFITPIGYQTNLIIYGPGGYRFTDYLKVGFLLSIFCLICTVSLTFLIWR
ncbi:SLC13 family permease [Thalassobacillus devorans]|uniref:SLC13 family permease n=1 Tax=Thalassobacillus devorans TaxID=279813 RepID=UPI000A1C8C09|nr:SLC13 family permease [Thalassobacillus devorans]